MAEATPEKKIANAMKAMDEGDFKKAYTAFKKLAAEIPDNADVWYYKAECGNYASGMFGAKVDVQEIMDAYKKAIELDGDRVDYYQSYGLFCISVNKYDEAEKAYCEAAEMDESMSASLYSEFAIEYYNNVMATYGEPSPFSDPDGSPKPLPSPIFSSHGYSRRSVRRMSSQTSAWCAYIPQIMNFVQMRSEIVSKY